MKCIAVYTNDFAAFSDIYDQVLSTSFTENEEKEISGIVVSESGEVPEFYMDRMKNKHNVVVMRERDKDITILQRKDVFEILLPT